MWFRKSVQVVFVMLMSWSFAFGSHDSLIHITQTRQDTHAVNACFEVGRQYFAEKEYDLAIHYFDKGDSLATQIDFDIGRLKLIRAKSVFYGRTGDVEKGHELNKMGLAMIDRINAPPVLKVDYLINLGALYYWEDKIGQAIEPYLEAVALCREYQFEDKRTILLNNLGIFYRNLERYPEAVSIYREALEIRRKNLDTLGTANILFNMAASYGSMDSANRAFQVISEAEELFRQLQSEDDILLCQKAKGSFLLDMHRYDEAYQYLAPLAQRNDLNMSPWHLSQLHIQIAQIHEKRDELNKAGKALDQIEDLLLSTNYTELLMEYYRLRHLQYKRSGELSKALNSIENYQQLSDTLNRDQQEKYRQEMLEKYLSVEKDFQISQQNIQILQSEKRRNQLLFAIFAIFLLAGGVIFYLRKRHSYRYQLTLRDNALKNEKIEKLEQEQKIIALDYMLMGEENERKRIAKDLHDSLGALLATAKLHLKNLYQEFTQPVSSNVVDETEAIIEHAAQEVRRISHDMMPDALVNLGMVAAIDDLANTLNEHGTMDVNAYSFDVDESALTDQQKVGIYRIVQELTQNALKHAHASQLVIQLTQENNMLTLVVEDDGIGFDPDQSNEAEGIGLKNIRSRVQYLNGDIHIDSKDGGPTIFSIAIPV